ncbi:MAG TPA: hypothetical protein VNF92_06790 [Gemmatimonadaceae bacterium]|nr:hypothetical protein [Gemmatimonadaceae bacterium]
MNSHMDRARWTIAAAVGVGLMLTAGCDVNKQLLEPQQPGVISPASVVGATGAEALRTGAIGRFQAWTAGGGNNNQENMVLETSLFTDEYKSGDTFSQRNSWDQRIVQTNDQVLAPAYTAMQQARGYIQNALQSLKANVPTAPAEAGQMYFLLGYTEMQLGEFFCNGIALGYTENGSPNYTQPLTDQAVFAVAAAHFDSATAASTGTDALSVQVHNAAAVGKARVLVDMGQFAQAAAAVSAVTTSFQYTMTYAQTSQDNDIWIMTTNVKRYTVGDSFDIVNGAVNQIKNAIPFASAADPRVPVTGGTTNFANKSFDGNTAYVGQALWGRDDPNVIVSGIDARLVEAEAKLQTNDYAGMVTILNALRAGPQTLGVLKVPAMAAIATTPTTLSDAVSLYFREKAFWQFGRGVRLGDMRRLIRQYGRTQDNVFPTGVFFKGGNYGTDVNFPVPDADKSNPNFNGCLDRNA